MLDCLERLAGKEIDRVTSFATVMPGFEPGIPLGPGRGAYLIGMAGTSPAMTERKSHEAETSNT